MSQSWLPVQFVVKEKTTKQAFYICKDIQHFYFSWAACIDMGILPENFPNPLADKQYKEVDPKPYKCEDQLPDCPQDPLLPATEENIGKFKS